MTIGFDNVSPQKSLTARIAAMSRAEKAQGISLSPGAYYLAFKAIMPAGEHLNPFGRHHFNHYGCRVRRLPGIMDQKRTRDY